MERAMKKLQLGRLVGVLILGTSGVFLTNAA